MNSNKAYTFVQDCYEFSMLRLLDRAVMQDVALFSNALSTVY